MKVTKSIVFFIFVLITYTAIVVNYIVIKTATQINIEVLETLDMIHLSADNLEEGQREEIINIVDSNSTTSYKSLVNSRSPIKNFYGFCGYLKGNQKSSFKFFKSNPLLNMQKVSVAYNGKVQETTLSHALIILLNETPEWLSRPLSNEFVTESETYIVEALNNLNNSPNIEHKKLLIKLALTGYESIRKSTTETMLSTDLSTLSADDKLLLTYYIPYLDNESKDVMLAKLLDEKIENILLSAIDNIDKESDGQLIEKLYDLMIETDNSKIKVAAVMKYGTLLDKKSLPIISKILDESYDNDIMKACITLIGLYGNSSYYEDLRIYLGYRYGLAINIEALKAIVSTTYNVYPEKVVSTLTFIIRNTSEHKLAKYAIKVHIDKSIKANSALIILRLRQRDSIRLPEMKRLALDYIEKFQPTTSASISLVRTLTSDRDSQTKKRANKLLEKLIKIRDNSAASSAGSTGTSSGATTNNSSTTTTSNTDTSGTNDTTSDAS